MKSGDGIFLEKPAIVGRRELLKNEISVLTPKEQASLVKAAVNILTDFEKCYSGIVFLSPQQKEELAQEIVIVSVGDFHRLWQELFPKNRPFSFSTTAFSYRAESLIVGKDFRTQYYNADHFYRLHLENIYKNRKEAMETYTEMLRDEMIAHELSHEIQDVSLPEVFLECGGTYYGITHGSMRHRGYTLMSGPRPRYQFYKKLIEQHGEKVHELFFGKEVAPEVKAAILNVFTKEIVEALFPQGIGLASQK